MKDGRRPRRGFAATRIPKTRTLSAVLMPQQVWRLIDERLMNGPLSTAEACASVGRDVIVAFSRIATVGTSLGRKSEVTVLCGFCIIHTPNSASMTHTASVMPSHDVRRRLAERRKTLAASRPQLPLPSGSP